MRQYEYRPSADRLRAAMVAVEAAIDLLDMEEDVALCFDILHRLEKELRDVEARSLADMKKAVGG